MENGTKQEQKKRAIESAMDGIRITISNINTSWSHLSKRINPLLAVNEGIPKNDDKREVNNAPFVEELAEIQDELSSLYNAMDDVLDRIQL